MLTKTELRRKLEDIFDLKNMALHEHQVAYCSWSLCVDETPRQRIRIALRYISTPSIDPDDEATYVELTRNGQTKSIVKLIVLRATYCSAKLRRSRIPVMTYEVPSYTWCDFSVTASP